MDKIKAIEILEKYKEEILKEFTPSKVVLFGSYNNGTPSKDSDIDVGIIFDGFSGDIYKASRRLWEIAYTVSLDIEPHLLDIKNDKSGFACFVASNSYAI